MKIKLVLIFSGISSLLALGDRYEISYFYEFLMGRYSIHSIVTFSYLFTLFYLGYTSTQIPGGILSNRIGPSRVMSISIFFWSIFLFLIFYVHIFLAGIFASFVMGLFQGPIYPSMMQLLRNFYDDFQYPRASSVTTFFGDISPFAIFSISTLFTSIPDYPLSSVTFLVIIGMISGIVLFLIPSRSSSKVSPSKFKSIIYDGRYWVLGVSFLSYDAFFYVFLSWYPVIENFRVKTEYGGALSYLPWIIMGISALLFGVIMSRVNKDQGISIISYLLILMLVGAMIISGSLYFFILIVCVILSLLNPILLGFWRLSTRISGSQNSSIAGGWMNFWGNLGGLISPFLAAYSLERFGLIGIIILMEIFVIVGLISRFELGEISNEQTE